MRGIGSRIRMTFSTYSGKPSETGRRRRKKLDGQKALINGFLANLKKSRVISTRDLSQTPLISVFWPLNFFLLLLPFSEGVPEWVENVIVKFLKSFEMKKHHIDRWYRTVLHKKGSLNVVTWPSALCVFLFLRVSTAVVRVSWDVWRVSLKLFTGDFFFAILRFLKEDFRRMVDGVVWVRWGS